MLARHSDSVRARIVAESIAEDVTAILRGGARLRVARSDIVAPYAASDLNAEEAGRAMNVRAVALCTVDAAPERIDVSIHLLDVLREAAVLAERFLARAGEIAAVEREIVRTIASQCDGVDPDARGDTSAAACASIVEARVARASGDARRALAILEMTGSEPAVALEIARTIIDSPLPHRVDDARAQLGAAGHTATALQLWARLLSRFDRDWTGAEAAARQALEVDPASPGGHSLLADLLLATGRRSEAAPHYEMVAEWMPLDERAQISSAFAAYFGPQPADAMPRLAELATRFPGAHDWLVRAAIAGGDILRAREETRTPFARALVAAFVGEPYDAASLPPFARALVHAAAGRGDDAVHALARAEWSDGAMFAAVEPLFGAIRSEKRFERFSRRFTPNLRIA